MNVNEHTTLTIEDVDWAQIYVDGESECIVSGSGADGEITVELHDYGEDDADEK